MGPGSDEQVGGVGTSRRRASHVRLEAVIAVTATAVTTALAAGTAVLGFVVGQVPAGTALVTESIGLIVGVAISTVGAVIVVRRPGNRIGRLLALAGLLYGLLMFTWVYAAHSVSAWEQTGDPSDIGMAAVAAVWMSNWIWIPIVLCLLVLVPLLYPDGRLVTPRWRGVVWAASASGGTLAFTEVARPGPLRFDEQALPVDNAFGIAALEGLDGATWTTGVGLALVGMVVVAFASLVVRYRRSGTIVRLQIRWLAASLALVLFAATISSYVPWLAWLNDSFNILFIVVPLAIATAILRHGLYEIDRIISRTLAWTLLTAVLVGLYASGVVALGSVARALTGGTRPEWVVALSTLLAAAAFGPTRGRIQAAVDRRFNRARHDAGRLVNSFANIVRDEVELETVTTALRTVAAASVEPTSTGVWLAVDGRGSADEPRNGVGTPGT